MTYKTIKWIKGNPYLYEVRSEREGDRVRQVFVRYLGRVDTAEGRELQATYKGEMPVRVEPEAVVVEPEVVPAPQDILPTVGKAVTVDKFYDKSLHSWIITKRDAKGNQVGDAEYAPRKVEADIDMARLEKEIAEAVTTPVIEEAEKEPLEDEYLKSLKSDIDRIESKYKETKSQIKSLESQSKNIFQQIVGNPNTEEKANLEQHYRDINKELTALRMGVKNTPTYIRQLKMEYKDRISKYEPTPTLPVTPEPEKEE